jgi:hypothetical protein
VTNEIPRFKTTPHGVLILRGYFVGLKTDINYKQKNHVTSEGMTGCSFSEGMF